MTEVLQAQNSDPQNLNAEKKELMMATDNESPTKKGLDTVSSDLYSDEEMKQITIGGIKSLLGGLLLHLELGTFYVFGSISPYICAWMREVDTSVTLNFMSIIFPILCIITMACLSFGIKIAERIGFKLTIGICSCSIPLAYLILSFVQNIGGFTAIFCIMIGISGGLAYMLPLVCGWRFFPNRRGLVSGITIGGYGFGSFIMNFICKAVANPDNEHASVKVEEDGKTVKYFDSKVGDQVPAMFRVMAACYLGLAIISILLIRYPSEIDVDKLIATLDAKTKKDQIANNETVQITQKYLSPEKECQTVAQGAKSGVLIMLVMIVLMSCTLGMLISNCYKFYGTELGIDDATLTATGSVAGVMNGSSRFFWATLSDKTSFRFTFILISVINLLTSAILPYNKNGIGYLLLIAIVYLSEGGLVATYPLISVTVFGKKVGGVMYGFLSFMIGISSMLGFIFYRYARVAIGWEGVYWLNFGMNIIGIGLGLILKEKGYDWSKPKVEGNEIPETQHLKNVSQPQQ